MPWWGWIIVGALLLGAELLGVEAAFYLIFIGFAAVVTGLVVMAGIALPVWAQWLLFASLAIVSMVLFRKRLYAKFRGVSVDYKEGLAGDLIQLSEPLEAGARGRIDYRGTEWTALNSSGESLAAGSSVRVVRVEGLTLVVEPAESR